MERRGLRGAAPAKRLLIPGRAHGATPPCGNERLPKGIDHPAALYGIGRRAASLVVRIVREGQRHDRAFTDAKYGDRRLR